MTPNIEILNSAANAAMNPEEGELFDKFDDDTKQRFLNQILKRAAAEESVTSSPGNRAYQFLRRQVWFQRAVDDNLRPTNHLDEMDSVVIEAADNA